MIHSRLYGEWSGASAAGCPNFGRYDCNPSLSLRVPDAKGPKSTSIMARVRFLPPGDSNGDGKFSKWPSLNLAVYERSASDAQNLARREPLLTSNNGVYCNPPCGAHIPKEALAPGDYLIIPSSFNPGCEGRFMIDVYSDAPVSVTRNYQSSHSAATPPEAPSTKLKPVFL